MNIDHILEKLRTYGVSPTTLDRLRATAQHLPEREAMPEPEDSAAISEAISIALQRLGIEPRPDVLDVTGDLPPRATVGGGDDEQSDWQKSLWRDREWKK